MIAEEPRDCVSLHEHHLKTFSSAVQKLHTFLPEHRQWRGLYGERTAIAGLGPM